MSRVFFIVVFYMILASCEYDKYESAPKCEERVVYGQVKELINIGCNLSGCHDGASGVGNYNTYKGLEASINDGSFNYQVFVARLMPPVGYEISDEDMQLLKCWSDNGFPFE